MLWIRSAISLVDLRGFFRELADFVGNNGKAQAVFAGAGGFNGGVERQEVGLLREIVDDFDNLADVIGAMAEHVDDFGGRLNGTVGAVQAVGGLFHGLNTGADFFAGAVGDVEQDFCGVRDALDGGDHLIDGCGGFRDARSLDLRVLHHILHVDAHLVHGAGDFLDGRGGLHANFGGFVGSAGDLIGAGRNLAGGIACGAHEGLQAVRHAHERVAQGIALRTRDNFDAEIAFGHGHGDAGHFLKVGDHVVEGGGQGADFIVTVNVDVLVKIAGVADFAGHGDEVLQRLGDIARG
jgi:hypothetical protein